VRLLLVAGLLWTASIAPAQTKPDADAIIRKSLERDFFDFNSVKNYTYVEREEVRQYDGKGKLTKTESHTHEILVLSGSPYEKLIEKNDKPLSENDARKEQEKIDKEHAKREHMSASEHAKIEKERQEERKYLREIPDAFDLHLLDDDRVSGLPAWVIEATPKAGFKFKNSKAKIFGKVRGKVWIDKGEYHWVKMEAIVNDPISYGLGLFKIAEGAAVKFEQKRVNDEVWLPTHIQIRGEARIAYMKKLRLEIELTYRDYRKFQTDSKIVTTAEKQEEKQEEK
jgi:hypothetical protein